MGLGLSLGRGLATCGLVLHRRHNVLFAQERPGLGRHLHAEHGLDTSQRLRVQTRGLRSRPFDGEGLPTTQRALVENGRIFGWLTNSASARQLGAPLSGHASRGGGGSPGVSASNIHLEPGTLSRDELIADIADGVLITSVFGQGVNMVTGDYSRGANGFRIVDGRIAGPVAEITIAGNLLAMFRALVPADDLEMIHSVNVPTLRVDGMTVAGG